MVAFLPRVSPYYPTGNGSCALVGGKIKYAEMVSGVIFISSEGEAIIKANFTRTVPQTKLSKVSANQILHVSGEVSTLIAMLQKELDMKNKQIAELTATVKMQAETIAIAQQTTQVEQMLHVGTIQKQLSESSDQAKLKGFWQRILGRKE
jgi:hypothetical protein